MHGNLERSSIPVGASATVFLSHVRTGAEPQTFRHKGFCLVLDGELFDDSDFDPKAGTLTEDKALQLIRLYDQKGPAFLSKLRGSFSLALWDSKSQRLLLAVDPFATKPLYYSCEEGILSFASRISCFSASPELSREIDPNALYFYLNHSFVPADRKSVV